MRGALGHHLLSLPGHQVQQLVDKEAGRQGNHSTHWYGDKFSAYRAAELGVPSKGGHNPGGF